MNHVLRHFSIVDITHHAEIESLTGKVKFQFSDCSDFSEGIEDYIVIDVVISANTNDTLEMIKDGLLDKAALVMESALVAVRKSGDRAPAPTHAAKLN